MPTSTINAPSDVLEELGRRFAILAREAFDTEATAHSDTMKVYMIKASYGEFLLQVGVRALEILPRCRASADMSAALDEWEGEHRTGFDQIIGGIAVL
jgi:hypothetical protein